MVGTAGRERPVRATDDPPADLEAALAWAIGRLRRPVEGAGRTWVALLGPDGGIEAAAGPRRSETVNRALVAASGADDLPPGWVRRELHVGDGRTAVMLVEHDTPHIRAAAEGALLGVSRAALLVRDRRRADEMTRLLATAKGIAASLELDTVLADIVRDATTLLGADSGDMLLLDRGSGRLRVVAVWQFAPDMIGFEMEFGEGVSSQAIAARRPLLVDDYATYEHRVRALDGYGFRAILCAPLLFRDEPIGALNMHVSREGHRFRPGDADLLAAFADHAAIAIDHARRYENEVRLGRELARSNTELARSLAVQQRVAEQVLLDAGPPGIATTLAELLSRPVVIQDHLHRVVARAVPSGRDDAGVEDGAAYSVPVRVGRELVGHLVLPIEGGIGPVDRALVDIAATGVALEFAKIRAAVAVEQRVQGETVADLVSGSYPDEETIARRVARLGHDVFALHHLLVFSARAPEGADRSEGADGAPRDARPILDAVVEQLAHRGQRALGLVQAGQVVVIVAATGREPSAEALAEELRASLAGTHPGISLSVGVGDPCRRPDDYAPAYRLARESLAVMERLGRTGLVVGPRELGPYRLLLAANSRTELVAFAERALRPLVEHDRAHGTQLRRTLRAYLEAGRVQRRAAEACFVHVNTIVYRVRRIEELLGRDLGDPDAVFDLTLALRILDIVESEADVPRSSRAAADVSRP